MGGDERFLRGILGLRSRLRTAIVQDGECQAADVGIVLPHQAFEACAVSAVSCATVRSRVVGITVPEPGMDFILREFILQEIRRASRGKPSNI